MRAVFVSYRSADLQHGARQLCHELSAWFGPGEIVLDSQTFAAGVEWLPQIRSGVAASSIIVAAIGPEWIASFLKAAPVSRLDFVIEELELARRIGIPILPVLFNGVSPADLEKLPSNIGWIKEIHSLALDLSASSSMSAVLSEVSRLGNLRPKSQKRRGLQSQAENVLRELWQPVAKPFRSGARALQSTVQSLATSIVLLAFSSSLVALVVFLYSGEGPGYKAVQISAASSTFIGVQVVLLALVSYALKGKLNIVAVGAWSIRFTAAILTIFAFWMAASWLFLPADVLSSIAESTSGNETRTQQLESIARHFSPSVLIPLVLLNVLVLVHALFLLWGYSWAGASVAGGKSRTTFALFLIPLLLFLAVVAASVSGVRTWRGTNIPGPVSMRYGTDLQTPDSIVRSKLLVEAKGQIELRGDFLVLRIDSLSWENRSEPTFNAFVWCNLGTWKDGKLDWPNPLIVSENQFLGEAKVGSTYTTSRPYTLRLKLNRETRSELTRLECSFGDVMGKHWRIDDGRLSTLRW